MVKATTSEPQSKQAELAELQKAYEQAEEEQQRKTEEQAAALEALKVAAKETKKKMDAELAALKEKEQSASAKEEAEGAGRGIEGSSGRDGSSGIAAPGKEEQLKQMEAELQAEKVRLAARRQTRERRKLPRNSMGPFSTQTRSGFPSKAARLSGGRSC